MGNSQPSHPTLCAWPSESDRLSGADFEAMKAEVERADRRYHKFLHPIYRITAAYAPKPGAAAVGRLYNASGCWSGRRTLVFSVSGSQAQAIAVDGIRRLPTTKLALFEAPDEALRAHAGGMLCIVDADLGPTRTVHVKQQKATLNAFPKTKAQLEKAVRASVDEGRCAVDADGKCTAKIVERRPWFRWPDLILGSPEGPKYLVVADRVRIRCFAEYEKVGGLQVGPINLKLF